ncbi:MAG: aspartate aminotransferase family protein [Vicinamibacterales bacterium]
MSDQRRAAMAMDPDTFRTIGHKLVDDLAHLLASIPTRPLTRDEPPATLRDGLGLTGSLPEQGTDAAALLAETTRLLFEHSLFNAHPKFFGYITSSPAPIGMLADFLASALNANVGSWTLSPAATELEVQTVRWLAQFIGYPSDAGGLLVSGGNMANIVGFLAARAAGAPWDVRVQGMAAGNGGRLLAYASAETHTWIQKAADITGLGTDALRWIPTDAAQRLDPGVLARTLDADRAAGHVPFVVVGTAGSVSTGAVDPLRTIAAICRDRQVWFHVDGAYGGFAAAVAGPEDDLRGLADADSVAVDPHKWLYAPLEAGCVLVRRADALRHAFAYHPPYYHFDERLVNFVDLGPQNSRGFRALKVWLALRQAGAAGYRAAISEDIALARALALAVGRHPDLELATQSLSITTFRYVPPDLRPSAAEPAVARYLDDLNKCVLDAAQRSGELFVSNAVVDGRYLLRACIVNFHTSAADVEAVPDMVASLGARLDRERRLTLAG